MKQTSIVYLLGSPGVGKRTVALALARRTRAVVIDNQTVNIPTMALFDWDGRSRLPPQIWAYIDQIRDAMLSALQEIAPPHVSYVLTNTLEQDEASDALFNRVRDIANARRALFVPVLLTCQLEEQLRRVASEDRVARLKMSDPADAAMFIESTTFYQPRDDGLLELDTTASSPDQSADAILNHVHSLR